MRMFPHWPLIRPSPHQRRTHPRPEVNQRPARRLRRQLYLSAVASAALAPLAACSDSGTRSLPTVPEALAAPSAALAASVSAQAAAALDASGRFQLPDPTVASGSEVTRLQAVALARAYVKTHGPSLGGLLELQRGARVAVDKLRDCGRPVYAASPFEASPVNAPGFVRRALGSWWIVPFCEAEEQPAALIAVSAHNIGNLTIGSDGKLLNTNVQDGGTDILFQGVVVNETEPLVITPERAARYAADASGRRVAFVPDLISPSFREGDPFAAHWHLKLESPARVRGAQSGAREVTDVFAGTPRVGKTPVAVPALQQPADVTIDWGATGPQRSLTVRRRADVPIRFESATADPGGAP